MTRYTLPYDKGILELELPDSARVVTLRPAEMEPLEDPEEIFINNLESPVEGKGIGEMAGSVEGGILVVIPDHTRVCGKERALTWLVDTLGTHGVDAGRITVLVALGSHKAVETDVLENTIGEVFSRVEVVQHDPYGKLTDYGTTSRGTQVKINSLYEQAELVILYTSVVHHYFAGFGGGRKIIVPGIASLDTISSNHSLVFEGEGRERHPMVRSGQLDGNPVHEDMLESSRLALDGKKYIAIAVAMTQSKEFGFITAGDIDSAHRRACEWVEEHNVVKIDCLADVVIASAGGFPKDTNVIQAHKGMDNAIGALKPGGTLFYVMSCSQGPGHPAVEKFAPFDKAKIREELARDYVVYGQTVYAMKEKAERFNVLVMSYLDEGLWEAIGFRAVKNPEDVTGMLDDSGLIYHMPRADMTLPRL